MSYIAEKPEDRPKCEVDGQTYLEGEGFIPNNEPNLACQCLEGYKGKLDVGYTDTAYNFTIIISFDDYCRRERSSILQGSILRN